MSTTTTNYGWAKPTKGADFDAWGDELNATIDAVDAVAKAISDVANGASSAASAAAATANAALPKSGGTMTGGIKRAGSTIGNIAPGTPQTILNTASVNGGIDAQLWIIGAGVGGPGGGYCIALDTGGTWFILAQGSGGAGSGITFSGNASTALQVQHSYGGNSNIVWNAFLIK